jgi:hypothetical protein
MKRLRLQTRRERGVATLIVVMVLFFIVTMVAAYASRNLIFEQRTGANIYRSTQAIELAEAGLQWTLARLNGGLVDEECLPDDTGPSSFRERYMGFNAANSRLVAITPPTPTDPDWLATCVWDSVSGDWSCACPVSAAATPASAADAGVAGAFRVRWEDRPRPGTLQVEVTACTLFNDDCLIRDGGSGVINEGRAVIRQLIYQTGVSIALPVAPMTARGSVSAVGLTVTNSRIGDSGITMHLGGNVIGSPPNLNTLAGSALGSLDSAILDDTALNPAALTGTEAVSAEERFFANLFNMGVATARAQPGLLMLGDCGGSCSGADVSDGVDAHPGRPIWVDGDLAISTDIGSVTAPVVLIVNNGQLSLSAGATIHGLVMVRPSGSPASWSIPSEGRVHGAVVVDGNVSGGVTGGTFEVDYDGELLRLAKLRNGSFVAVGGGWRDGSN